MRQRVIANGIETNYADVNKELPQGTVVGPFLFCLMINDVKVNDPNNNLLLVKFADDMTVSAPVKENYDSAQKKQVRQVSKQNVIKSNQNVGNDCKR